MKSLVLSFALLSNCLLGGCATWNVTGFGVPMQATSKFQTVDDSKSMSTEEKWGVVLIIGVAVGAGIAIAAAGS